MKRIIQTLLLLLIVVGLNSCSAGDSTQNGEKISLFNGKDLSGWTINGTEKWYVENGELVCESGPEEEYGYLSTDEKYKNFECHLEFYFL